MLEAIILLNFQRHEKLTLRLSPTVTTITGKSDSGKSSVIRALYWLTFNRPLGDSFVRHGFSKCKVTIKLDSRKLSRRKAKGNQYLLDDKQFDAVRFDVPEEIQNLLNLGPENFQRQHDPHFWLSLSSGDLSRELNRIVSLDLIDRTQQRLGSLVRTHKARIQVCEERLEQAQRKRDSLAWVEEAYLELCILEDKYTAIQTKASRIDSARLLVQEGRRVEERRQNVSDAIVDAGNVLSLGESLVKKQEQYNLLYNLTKELRETCQRSEKMRNALKESQNELSQVQTCPLCGGSISKLSS